MKRISNIVIILSLLAGLVCGLVWWTLGPAGQAKPTVFVVGEDADTSDVSHLLFEGHYITNEFVFGLLWNIMASGKKVTPGGYRIQKSLWAWQLIVKVTGKPDLLWVTITGCKRKEEIGDYLDRRLGWSEKTLYEWNNAYTIDSNPEYAEGVYYPDTYLLPVDESGKQIADRFIDRFNEMFAPLADEYVKADVRWTTGLKIASLIAREAGGTSDMATISGIIWNRLNTGMKLEIDATMQYTQGKRDDGFWWGTVDLKEKQSDSPYNTYRHLGLPPTPICSPGINAIQAVVRPEETDCLFYLHDKDKQIHCAKTYSEHLSNITKYLR